MSIVKKSFGTLADGRQADLYILTNASGASVEITNYGGIIRAINVPDKDGRLDSVVLGYNDVNGYVPTVGYLGALIGRVGNRIANGECVLNGQKLTLAKMSVIIDQYGGVDMIPGAVLEQRLTDGVTERSCGGIAHSHADGHATRQTGMGADIPEELSVALDALTRPGAIVSPGEALQCQR